MNFLGPVRVPTGVANLNGEYGGGVTGTKWINVNQISSLVQFYW